MHQEFTIGPIKLEEDADGFGISCKTQVTMGNAGELADVWEVVANFKYGPDALQYFTSYMNDYLTTGQTRTSFYEQRKETDKN